MSIQRNKDDSARLERTPYNSKADYRDIDLSFRNRLDAMVPAPLAMRIQSLLRSQLRNEAEEEKDAIPS
ncbi:MAG: hypothetical protein AB1656_26830 [Candidatus Omnitrophota bacterium]